MAKNEPKLYTIAEYVAFEDASETKHEYHNGKIIPVFRDADEDESYCTLNHGILGSAINRELGSQIEVHDLDCTPISSNAKIYIESLDSVVYADASVFCGKPQMSTVDKNAITNPVLIVEVLSKSTESYDRSGKFSKYGQLDSFREYLLISQDEPVVESYYREENDTWRITRIAGLENSLSLPSLGIEISLKRLYRDVDFT